MVRRRRVPAHFSRGVVFFDAASVGSPDLTDECVDTALFEMAVELRPFVSLLCAVTSLEIPDGNVPIEDGSTPAEAGSGGN